MWRLLGWWVWLYVFVGVQTGWILRPFVGHPDKPFVLFRGKEGGFIEGVLHHLWNALFGDGHCEQRRFDQMKPRWSGAAPQGW